MAWEAATNPQQVGTKRPAPSTPLDEAEDQRKPFESTRTAAHTDHEVESGHPCGCPLVPPVENNPVSPPIEEAKRRSRWASSLPAVSAAPPLSVDKTRQSAASLNSPTSPAGSAEKGVDEASTPQATARPGYKGLLQSSPKWLNQLNTRMEGSQSRG